jgi:very-short-patch-repair endonuclease
MRRDATPPEHRLWQALRREALGLKWRRRQPIGRYIVDFYCSSARLVVEVDGATHADPAADAARDAWLAAQGLRVLRFWNNEVMGNPEGVLAAIFAAAEGTQE